MSMINDIFQKEGHKSWHITNILFYVQSLRDFHKLWLKKILDFPELLQPPFPEKPLDSKQTLPMLHKRREHYGALNNRHFLETATGENERDIPVTGDDHESVNEDTIILSRNVDWEIFLLVVGQPGTGKSYLLKKCIEKFSSDDWKIFVCTPTGIPCY